MMQADCSGEIIIAAGEPSIRKLLYNKVLAYNIPIVSIISPKASVSKTAKIAQGCCLHINTIISSKAFVEDNCVINKGAIIGHHVLIGKNSSISPGAIIGGYTVVGENTFVGSGAVIRDRIHIGKNCIIGMGAVVTKDIEDNDVVVGNPAKHIRNNTDGKIFKT